MIKTLDRYVVANFLYSYVLCFLVMMGLRVVADLFVNVDEFYKLPLHWQQLVVYVATYYGFQSLTYFQQLGGVIVVVAAAFSLARMNHTNELTAMLASGVSLHRVIWPVILVGMAMSALNIANEEWLIPQPSVRKQVARERDDVEGTNSSQVRLLTDGQRNVWWSNRFYASTSSMTHPMILLRDRRFKERARLFGDEARYDNGGFWRVTGGGVVIPGRDALTTSLVRTPSSPETLARQGKPRSEDGMIALRDNTSGLEIAAERIDPPSADTPSGRLRHVKISVLDPTMLDEPDPEVLTTIQADSARYIPPDKTHPGYYKLSGGTLLVFSDLTPDELILRQSSSWMEYLSTKELNALMREGRISDEANVRLAKHTRFTEPLANLIMLLLGLPFILSRERNIKASAGLCLLMVGACYTSVFMSRYMGGYGLDPVLAAWLPILIFGPIAALMLDSVKT